MLTPKKISGFTLVELLIALALNAILFAALLAMFTSNLYHYTKTVNINRLNQQLQQTLELMSDDIRRAGYWANAANDVGTGANNNPFMATAVDITVTGGNCILFAYDHASNGTLPAISTTIDDDRYGYRLSGTAVQERPPGATFACTAAANNWENITDPNVVKITALSFTLNTSTVTTGPGAQGITLRSVDISLTGQLVSDATITKTITQHVRIRNDKFIP